MPCPPPRLRAARHGLLLRPQLLRPAEEGLPAVVIGAQFRGHAMQVALMVEERVPVVVDWPHGMALPQPGGALRLSADARDARLVAED